VRLLLILLLAALPCAAQDALTTRLYQQLAAQGGNVFFSPYSLRVALAMAKGGARGPTRAELDRLVGEVKVLPGLKQANRVFVERSRQLLPEYLKYAASFGAEPERVDFERNTEQARQTINRWVAAQTADKISELIPRNALDSSTLAVLTNAVYFKESWKHAFAPELTTKATFYSEPPTEVPMMSQKAPVSYGEADEAEVCELPYAGDYAMTIVLPRARDGLPALEKALTPETLQGYLAALKPLPEVHVALPRFKTETSYQLKRQLEALGLQLAFSGQADFSGMTGTNNLQLGEVFHGGFVDVTEKGTEAAAATAVSVVLRNGSGSPHFRCDRPFLYLIRHRPAGTVVFMGRFVKP